MAKKFRLIVHFPLPRKWLYPALQLGGDPLKFRNGQTKLSVAIGLRKRETNSVQREKMMAIGPITYFPTHIFLDDTFRSDLLLLFVFF